MRRYGAAPTGSCAVLRSTHAGTDLYYRAFECTGILCWEGAAVCCVDAIAQHARRYTQEWKQHVLAHVPFYLTLFPAAMELVVAIAGISTDAAYRSLYLIAKVRIIRVASRLVLLL